MLFKKRVEQDGLAALVSREIELTTQLALKRSALAQARAAASQQFIDGNGSGGAANVTLQNHEVDAISDAIREIRRMRADVITNGYRSQARELRKQCAGLQTEIASCESRRAELLSQLAELEGVELAVAPALGQAEGLRSMRLRSEFNGLERRAVELECKTPEGDGGVDLDDIASNDGIVAAALNDPSLGPDAETITAWLSACEEAARKKFLIAGFENRKRRVFLLWRNGAIDTAASYVFIPELAMPIPSMYNQGKLSGFDVPSAKFRSVAAA